MMRSKMTWAVLAAVAAAILLVPTDADGGRGSLKHGKKSRLKWDRNKWGGGDSYPGESRKSSSDRRPKRRDEAPPADHTFPAVPRGAPGTVIAELPKGAESVYAGGRRFHYSGGVFLAKKTGSQQDGYEIVAPPYGAVVDAVPSDFEKKQVGTTTYYVIDGVYYRRIMRSDEISYIVSKAP